ncbi:S-Ena type endospore appendage [Lysinibacillus sp. NPDC047702]|uniref:S-Ena type endospore appendage n=1 Tax=unclassified Lysinibacillus TaxID=2636778 RepID=UPI003D04CC5C
MHLNKDHENHCVKVPRVFDWICKSTVIKLKEIIKMRNKNRFDDFICCDFCIPYGEKSTLWSSYGIKQIGGSICINFNMGNVKRLSVFVNGEKQAEIFEGGSFSATFKHLESIEVQCNRKNDDEGSCCGDLKIMLHFYPNDECNLNLFKDIKKTKCYLSDCHGNSFLGKCLVTCKELTCSDKRENIQFVNDLGNIILLKRVDILTEGYVCVEFINQKEELCFKRIFPFSEIETVVICAPDETDIKCEITNVDCRAHIIPSTFNINTCLEVVIILSICKNIKTIQEVIVELKGKICKPEK